MLHGACSVSAQSACGRGLQSYSASVLGHRRVVSTSQPGEVHAVGPGEEPLLGIHHRRPPAQERVVSKGGDTLPREVRMDAGPERLPVPGRGQGIG